MYAVPESTLRPASLWRLQAMARQLVGWTDEERGRTPERYHEWYALVTSVQARLRRDDQTRLHGILTELLPCA